METFPADAQRRTLLTGGLADLQQGVFLGQRRASCSPLNGPFPHSLACVALGPEQGWALPPRGVCVNRSSAVAAGPPDSLGCTALPNPPVF